MKTKTNTTLVKVNSVAYYGMQIIPIVIEVSTLGRGLPRFDIVGLPGKEVSESKHRIITALTNSGIEFPARKVVVNLAPADIPKEGSAYDFPIAVGLISAILGIPVYPDSLFFGELSLDGTVSRTKRTFLAQLFAHENGSKNVFLPKLNSQGLTYFEHINVYEIYSIKQFIDFLKGDLPLMPLPFIGYTKSNKSQYAVNFSEIIGHSSAKRALEISAAGNHNVLLEGPPGSGKTLLSKAYPSILPTLTYAESVEVTKLHALKGYQQQEILLTERPYRSPHHTVSYSGMVGGGSIPLPGEISLAHHGVLFMDEFPEFSRQVLESLRQPLEDGEVTITRTRDSFKFPSRFCLLASCNSCPCGFYKHPTKECKCTVRQIQNYRKKISGPIYDRLDLFVFVNALDIEKISLGTQNKHVCENSEEILQRVERAREVQLKRFYASGISTNSEMSRKEISEFCKLSTEVRSLLDRASLRLNLSVRAYFKVIKVSRTIADLCESSQIEVSHVAEALQYRGEG